MFVIKINPDNQADWRFGGTDIPVCSATKSGTSFWFRGFLITHACRQYSELTKHSKPLCSIFQGPTRVSTYTHKYQYTGNIPPEKWQVFLVVWVRVKERWKPMQTPEEYAKSSSQFGKRSQNLLDARWECGLLHQSLNRWSTTIGNQPKNHRWLPREQANSQPWNRTLLVGAWTTVPSFKIYLLSLIRYWCWNCRDILRLSIVTKAGVKPHAERLQPCMGSGSYTCRYLQRSEVIDMC